jgi:hypothetical protein
MRKPLKYALIASIALIPGSGIAYLVYKTIVVYRAFKKDKKEGK